MSKNTKSENIKCRSQKSKIAIKNDEIPNGSKIKPKNISIIIITKPRISQTYG